MKYASDYGNKEVSFVLNSTEEMAVKKGIITKAQYKEITGKDYK